MGVSTVKKEKRVMVYLTEEDYKKLAKLRYEFGNAGMSSVITMALHKFH